MKKKKVANGLNTFALQTLFKYAVAFIKSTVKFLEVFKLFMLLLQIYDEEDIRYPAK